MSRFPTLRTTSLVSASLLLTLGATACGPSKDDAGRLHSSPTAAAALPGSLASQKLNWQPCTAPSTAQGGGAAPGRLPDGTAWECATMKAPLDYAEPTGDTLDLAMIRAKAEGGGKRTGSLVFNFGGPGASGVATLPGYAPARTLRSHYDLVSFDPRGVGDSAGVRCLSDKEIDAQRAETYDLAGTAEQSKRTAAACAKHSGKVLPHVGTESAARDMDLMRQVLGDAKLNYFGMSYGTELGGVYAHLFPRRVGRTVLDAVVDPTRTAEQESLGQAKGFQLALDNYLAQCVKTPGTCPYRSPEDGRRRIIDLLARTAEQPLPTKSGRKLTKEQAIIGIVATLYSKEAWPALSVSLADAEQGSGDNLLMLADGYLGRDDKGHYNTMQSANTAVNCADTKQRRTPEEVQAGLPEFRKASPVFGEVIATGLLGCHGWPVTGTSDTPEVSAPGAAPIVVIGNAGDPATPVAGARKMAEKLGKGVGVLLTVEGEGHGTYGVNACATKAVNGHLLDGKVPANGTVCS
ncbi:alpha/beta fold hydrolase [Streptomyces sp. RPA4-5]|uniref:alpha/beta hydrolase n=1 Tax=Streptomyces TaxID=1883 RepID=UPI00143E38B4|nr:MULTISPECIES: alpha/beta hydrolase [Streptomyces]MCX4637107.1 alpha/beta fold hydrolase [Streptomyces platensis]QIY54128.1 alpha/beta fold hydrolase [Streptomyces sp. RPA4-5]